MTDEAPPSSDRRRAMRHVACFPTHVERPDEKHDSEDDKITALISDLAETGTLLLMRKPGFKIGDELRLELHVLLEGPETRIVTGRVVRLEPLPDERAYLWTHQVGVDFHERIELTPDEIEAMAKRQEPFRKHGTLSS